MFLGVEKGRLLLNWDAPDLVVVDIAHHVVMDSFVSHDLRQFALRIVVLNAFRVYLQDLW
jgi:hypothetical protein